MIEGPIAEKDLLWWAPHDPKAFEVVVVTGIAERDGTMYVQTTNKRTGVAFWNREIRVRQLCRKAPERTRTPKGAAV